MSPKLKQTKKKDRGRNPGDAIFDGRNITRHIYRRRFGRRSYHGLCSETKILNFKREIQWISNYKAAK